MIVMVVIKMLETRVHSLDCTELPRVLNGTGSRTRVNLVDKGYHSSTAVAFWFFNILFSLTVMHQNTKADLISLSQCWTVQLSVVEHVPLLLLGIHYMSEHVQTQHV